MAPSPGSNIYKHHFDNPTLSDLIIRLDDQRTVHVHRVILCRRSKYFEKLLLGPFQETGQEEIELHEDDSEAMMALFRYVYDLSYSKVPKHGEESMTCLSFLAKIYVVADKYQIQGLRENVTEQMETQLWDPDERAITNNAGPRLNDFLDAVKILFDGTTDADKIGRKALVNFCALCINDLKEQRAFKALVRKCGDLKAAMIKHEKYSLMLDGTWYCEVYEHKQAVPRCPDCHEEFDISDLYENRDERLWKCRYCDKMVGPVCMEGHEEMDVTWNWDYHM